MVRLVEVVTKVNEHSAVHDLRTVKLCTRDKNGNIDDAYSVDVQPHPLTGEVVIVIDLPEHTKV